MSSPGGGRSSSSESHGPDILGAFGEGAAHFMDEMAGHATKVGGAVDMLGGKGGGGHGGHEVKSHSNHSTTH